MTIVKALGYQYIRNRNLRRFFLVLIGFQILYAFMNYAMMEDTEGLIGAGGLLATNPPLIYGIMLMFSGIFAATLCGEDLKDKCAYYEILSGKGRFASYAGRAVFALFCNEILMMIACFSGVIFMKFAYEWGTFVSFSDIVKPTLMIAFPLLRLSAFTVMLTFILRNHFIAAVIGYVLFMGEMMIESMVENIPCHMTAYYEIENLFLKYPLDVKTALTTGVVASAVACIYLVIGYLVYKRSDLH